MVVRTCGPSRLLALLGELQPKDKRVRRAAPLDCCA
jgi:hypothetical protein